MVDECQHIMSLLLYSCVKVS